MQGNQHIKLSSTLAIPILEYASQGNAILGIRDAGKTYTAIKTAEELLEKGIPIIAYDPVGVWKNLKTGVGKHKGFPVVVAGGAGSDVLLNAQNAADIVRAAMKENVSLVIDLYSPELINKSTWIKIVQETVDLLMYENKGCGLRHIYIEEAAEFIPQRLQPQHSRVYASIERLARMGRNARLGYTIINQRAEEVNKAILEISNLSLLHKQVGKNSLLSIQKWLELLQLDNTRDIIKSLPTLKQGECWAVGMNTKPQLIQVSTRKTFHPNPKQGDNIKASSKMTVDVSSFVGKLNNQLQKEAKPSIGLLTKADSKLIDKLKRELELVTAERDYAAELAGQKDLQIHQYKQVVAHYSKQAIALREIINREPEVRIDDIVVPVATKTAKRDQPVPVSKSFTDHNTSFTSKVYANASTSGSGKLGKCALAILQFIASFPARTWTKAQVGIATGYSPNSGGFNNSLSELNREGLLNRTDGKLHLNQGVDISQWLTGFQPQEYSIDTFKGKLGKCEREIYEVLLKHPRQEFTKEELANATESKYSHSSGGFNNSLSTLNTLELIHRQSGIIKLNPELLEL